MLSQVHVKEDSRSSLSLGLENKTTYQQHSSAAPANMVTHLSYKGLVRKYFRLRAIWLVTMIPLLYRKPKAAKDNTNEEEWLYSSKLLTCQKTLCPFWVS